MVKNDELPVKVKPNAVHSFRCPYLATPDIKHMVTVALKWWCQELQRWHHCHSLPSASCVSWCLEGVPQRLHEWRLVSAPSPPLQEKQHDKTS